MGTLMNTATGVFTAIRSGYDIRTV
jgi:hypothetical protein